MRRSVADGDGAMRRIVARAAAMTITLLSLASVTRAAPPPDANPALAPWFQSLQRPDVGGSCCSVADCRRVQSRLGGSGYEVLLDDRWVAVPARRVLLGRDNPTGEAVVCARGHVIICFVPAPES